MTNFDLKTNASYLVAIEWDGQQPPTRWYRRLGKLGLRVGSKSTEVSPVDRRAASINYAGQQVHAVIYQEGAIMVSSFSLARLLKSYAKREGAINVRIAAIEMIEAWEDTAADRELLGRIENVFGRRGRAPEPEKWAVTCSECLSVTAQEAAAVVSCGNCGGLMIHARRGLPSIYADPGGDVVAAWLRLRFGGAHWEPATIDEAGEEPPALELCNYDDKGAWIAMENAPALDLIRKMDRSSAFLFLDAIYVNLTSYDRAERVERRVKAVVEYYRLGGAATVQIDEGEAPDLLVAAGPLAPRYVATALMALIGGVTN
jgi:hypothetical protein